MGLDGLGSSSYGPEAALSVMIPLGAASLAWVGWGSHHRGAARDSLPVVTADGGRLSQQRRCLHGCQGKLGKLWRATRRGGTDDRLCPECRRRISAGVGALTSSLPSLHSYTLPLCLVVLVLVVVANLRGTREAGWLFALPTYVFIASFPSLIALGVVNLVTSGWQPHPVVTPPRGHATEAVGPWLLLRAFAAGCTAMTGVEAVSMGSTPSRNRWSNRRMPP